MNVAVLLPKSGVSIRRRLGRDAVPWPQGRRSHAIFSRSRSISRSGSPSVPLHSPNVVALPPGRQIFGKTFLKDFGIKFAPLRHNWTYSIEPDDLNTIIVMGGGWQQRLTISVQSWGI